MDEFLALGRFIQGWDFFCLKGRLSEWDLLYLTHTLVPGVCPAYSSSAASCQKHWALGNPSPIAVRHGRQDPDAIRKDCGTS